MEGGGRKMYEDGAQKKRRKNRGVSGVGAEEKLFKACSFYFNESERLVLKLKYTLKTNFLIFQIKRRTISFALSLSLTLPPSLAFIRYLLKKKLKKKQREDEEHTDCYYLLRYLI